MAMRPHSLGSAVLVATLFASGSGASNSATISLGTTGHTFSLPAGWKEDPNVKGDVVYRCTAPEAGGYLAVYTSTEQQSLISLSVAHERRMEMARKGWVQKAEKEIDLRGTPSLYRIYATTPGAEGRLMQTLYYAKGARTFVVQAAIDASKYQELFKPAQRALLSLREDTPQPERAPKPAKPATLPDPTTETPDKAAVKAMEHLVRSGARSLAPSTAIGVTPRPLKKPTPETPPPDAPAPPKQDPPKPAPAEPVPTTPAPTMPASAFRSFADPSTGLRFEVPTHWTSQRRGRNTIFSGPRQTEEFRTTITLQTMALPTPTGGESSLDACAGQLLRQVQTSPSGQVAGNHIVTLAGLTVRRIQATFTTDGQSFCMDQAVMARSPHACWLGFTAPKDLFEKYHRYFERAVNSLSLAEGP